MLQFYLEAIYNVWQEFELCPVITTFVRITAITAYIQSHDGFNEVELYTKDETDLDGRLNLFEGPPLKIT